MIVRPHQRMRLSLHVEPHSIRSAAHGLATFAAFVAAGSVPLMPYVFTSAAANRFLMATVLSLIVLFVVGVARSRGNGVVVGERARNAGARRDRRRGAYGPGAFVATLLRE